MKQALCLFICMACGLARGAPGLKPVLTIQYLDNVEVSARDIHFGDIAVISGEGPEIQSLKSTKVGNSANFGLTRYLSTFSLYVRYLAPLEHKYRIQGHEDKRIKITTRAGQFPQDSLIRKIEKFLDQHPTGGRGEYEFDLLTAPGIIPIPVEACRMYIRAPESYKRKGRQALELVIETREKARRAIPLSVYIRNFDSVWVAKRRIGRASLISRVILEKAYREVTRLSGVPVGNLSELEGKKAKQTIIPGRIITSKLITLDPLIKQGQEVKVVAYRNGIVLTLDGIARQDGRLGQIIQVKNLMSHKLVRARVMENGTLELVSLVTRG